MLEYIKNPGQLSCLEEFKKHTFDTVKVQCVGPATLMMSHYDEEDAVVRTYEHITTIMDGLKAKDIILYLDEPALGYVGFDYEELWAPLFGSFDVTPGVHICGNMDWDKLFTSSIEIISFDASQYDLTRYPGYRNGKRISWGIEKQENAKDFQDGDLLTMPCGMSDLRYTVDDCKTCYDMLSSAASKYSNFLIEG